MELFIIAIFGWACGALVNYFADFLPYKRQPVRPYCLGCLAKISVRNYLFWPRRCTTCRRRRLGRTWLVELVYLFISLWCWAVPPEKLGFAGSMLLLVYFGIVVVIDIEHRLILHPVSLFGAIIGLGIGVYLRGLGATLLGGLVGFIAMLALYWLGEGLLRVVKRIKAQETEEVALGFGDVNLAGVLGLILGWPGIVAGLFLGILLGGAGSLIYLLGTMAVRRYRLFSALPYGPFLVAGAILIVFFPNVLLKWIGG